MPDPQKTSDKKLAAAVAAATTLAIVQRYVERAFGLAERAVVALERNAAATEKLASVVDEDSVRITVIGPVTTRPGV